MPFFRLENVQENDRGLYSACNPEKEIGRFSYQFTNVYPFHSSKRVAGAGSSVRGARTGSFRLARPYIFAAPSLLRCIAVVIPAGCFYTSL